MGTFISILIVAVVIVLGVVIFKHFANQAGENLRCKSCKEVFDKDDVDWSVIKTFAKEGQKKEIINTWATVKFNISCPKCGTLKEFTWDFCVSEDDRLGNNLATYDIDELVDEYLTKEEICLNKKIAKENKKTNK